MIKIAICDDESIITSQIENFIWNICNTENILIDTNVFYSGHELEKEIFKGERYDLIYLDIHMTNGDGITTAKNIRKMDENVLLIYISGYDRYMIELFRLDVFAFIKKPIEYSNFEKIFLDANQKICSKSFYFTFYYRKEEYKIPSINITYFESRGRTIIVHIKDNSVEKFNGRLGEVEEKLSSGKIPFLRIHQSYLVNYHHIHSRSKSMITLMDGTKLPISEERQRNFGKQYGKLLGGEVDA